MFDEGGRIVLFCVAAAAWIGTMAADYYGPRADLQTAIDGGQLPGLPASAQSDGAPAQTDVVAMRLTLGNGFEARLLHGYVLEGRVVTRREFRHDPTSAVSPLDLGIVWGPLAAPGGIDDLSFRTAPRGVRFQAAPGADLPDDWEEMVTNNHLIPADQTVNDALMAVRIGQAVRLSGYLVSVTGEGISPWRSSTRRDDSSIFGGCEIILVTDVEAISAAG